MTRLRGGAVTAVVVVFAVTGCTDLQGKGTSGAAGTGSGGAALSVLRGVIAGFSQLMPGVVGCAR